MRDGAANAAPIGVDLAEDDLHLPIMIRHTRSHGPKVSRAKLTEKDLQWRHDGMARLLNIAVRRMQARVIAKMVQSGHKDMRLALVNLTRNLDLDGTPITELARRAVMTKQAMGELADQCEKLGIVERTNDPADRRVRIVRFTPGGLEWLRELGEAVAEAEAEMVGVIGEPAYRALADWLRAYDRAELPELGPDWTGAVDDA